MPKVLIIDDNQKVSDLIARFLTRKGLAAAVARDGIAAIRSFRAEPYDLLLVNRELPTMNGDAFCRKIRDTDRGKDVPIVMMSGFVKEQADIEALQLSLRLAGFLAKPFTSEILLSTISSVLGSAPPAPSAPRQSASPPQQALKGRLDRTPFEQVLLFLARKKATGTLTVTREPVTRTVVLVRGAAADLHIPYGDSDFGDYLAAKKLIDPAELREYKERRKQEGSDERDLFVKMGCLTPGQFQQEHTNFLQERLGECFSWRTGSVLFEPSASVLKTAPSAAVLMPALFFRGFHAKACADAVRAFINEQGNRFPVRTAEFFEYQNHLAAEAQAAEALNLCDGRKTCSEILGSVDAEEAAILLYTLHYLKALTFSDARPDAAVPPPFPVRERAQKPAVQDTELFEDLRGELSELADEVGSLEPVAAMPSAAPQQTDGLAALEGDLKRCWQDIKEKNYYEMFGMKQKNFSFEKLKKAYFELTRTYGPEKFFASSGDIMSLAEEMLSKISNAYDTLSNVVSKESYDELLASQEQVPEGVDDKKFYEQIQFQSGKVFVDQGQYESAEKAFTNCVNLDPDRAEYLAYLALAVYQNPANRGNAAAIRRAKDTVNRSLQLGKLSIAYALKGTMYLDEGGLNFAEAEFNKALRLNPNNKTALKKLEIIKAKREEEKKGIFQRMFK